MFEEKYYIMSNKKHKNNRECSIYVDSKSMQFNIQVILDKIYSFLEPGNYIMYGEDCMYMKIIHTNHKEVVSLTIYVETSPDVITLKLAYNPSLWMESSLPAATVYKMSKELFWNHIDIMYKHLERMSLAK